MQRFPLFPTKMLKASPVSLCTEHPVQANNATSESYRKGISRSKVDFWQQVQWQSPCSVDFKVNELQGSSLVQSYHSFKKSPCSILCKTQLPVIKIKCAHKLLLIWDLTCCSYTTEIGWKCNTSLLESKTEAQRANSFTKGLVHKKQENDRVVNCRASHKNPFVWCHVAYPLFSPKHFINS